MTTLEPSSAGVVVRRPKFRWLRAIGAAIAAYRERRAHEAVLLKLSHYDEHLLRDMGIDPKDVAEALYRRRPSLLFDPIRPHRG